MWSLKMFYAFAAAPCLYLPLPSFKCGADMPPSLPICSLDGTGLSFIFDYLPDGGKILVVFVDFLTESITVELPFLAVVIAVLTPGSFLLPSGAKEWREVFVFLFGKGALLPTSPFELAWSGDCPDRMLPSAASDGGFSGLRLLCLIDRFSSLNLSVDIRLSCSFSFNCFFKSSSSCVRSRI